MNDSVQQVLVKLIGTYGQSLCDDHRRCEGLLRDLCGDNRREIFVLVNALKDGIPGDLLASRDKAPLEVLCAQLKKRLEDDFATDADAASWAVETWALALGLRGTGDTNAATQSPQLRGGLRSSPAPVPAWAAVTQSPATLLSPLQSGTRVICQKCKRANEPEEIYCQRCGHQLHGQRSCSYCGGSIPENARYCVDCGKAT